MNILEVLSSVNLYGKSKKDLIDLYPNATSEEINELLEKGKKSVPVYKQTSYKCSSTGKMKTVRWISRFTLDDWIKTYDLHTGELLSMQVSEYEHKKCFWFLRDPYELLTELGYSVTSNNAKSLGDFIEGEFVDVYYWFHSACNNKDQADEIIKWMIGPLKELMAEKEIKDLKFSSLKFHAIDFSKLVSKIVEKSITPTMGKDVLKKMFNGEQLDKILEDDKFKISSGDETEKFVNDVIQENPDQVNELKAGKDKLLPWLVGQVMKASRGKVNPIDVNKIIREKLDLK